MAKEKHPVRNILIATGVSAAAIGGIKYMGIDPFFPFKDPQPASSSVAQPGTRTLEPLRTFQPAPDTSASSFPLVPAQQEAARPGTPAATDVAEVASTPTIDPIVPSDTITEYETRIPVGACNLGKEYVVKNGALHIKKIPDGDRESNVTVFVDPNGVTTNDGKGVAITGDRLEGVVKQGVTACVRDAVNKAIKDKVSNRDWSFRDLEPYRRPITVFFDPSTIANEATNPAQSAVTLKAGVPSVSEAVTSSPRPAAPAEASTAANRTATS